jgi:hypothetical protein
VENSHGLLKNSLQQSIVQISQAFDPGFDGKQLFPTYTTRLEQSRRLLREIASLLESVREFEDIADHEALQPLLRSFEDFRQSSLKYLMFKDWEEFERRRPRLADALRSSQVSSCWENQASLPRPASKGQAKGDVAGTRSLDLRPPDLASP